jgi:hypothetical protein
MMMDRVLEIIRNDGPINSDGVAAKMWPGWRTQKRQVPSAAEGRAFRAMKALSDEGKIVIGKDGKAVVAR